MRKIGSTLVIAGFSIFSACGGSGSTGYGGTTNPDPVGSTCPANTLCMRSSVFQPTSLTVPKGTVVSFTNSSTVEHNIVFDSPPLGVTDIGSITSGTVTRTFGTTGTFGVRCTIHAGMNASIIVQ